MSFTLNGPLNMTAEEEFSATVDSWVGSSMVSEPCAVNAVCVGSSPTRSSNMIPAHLKSKRK